MARVILCTPVEGAELRELVSILEDCEVCVVQSAADLDEVAPDRETTLICFGTGTIIPKSFLSRLEMPGYNFHPASPRFPGRDPHHFAAYEGVEEYGATAHVLTARVDEGPIVGVELNPVARDWSATELLGVGRQAALVLFRRLAPAMASGRPLPPIEGVSWGPRKTRRADFLRMCKLPLSIDEEEFSRRLRSFDGGDYDNLTVTLHGQTFRIDKSSPPRRDVEQWRDFTETAYRELLARVRALGYETVGYGARPEGPHVLWRHDIDMSVHRAVRLATFEAEAGVTATYFLNPHAAFYSLMEPGIGALVRQIRDMGHAIGVHFDADGHAGITWTREALEECLGKDRRIVEEIAGAPAMAFSYHNPDVGALLAFDDDIVGGMVNAYGRTLRKEYVYASDSNGYWRHEAIPDVIAQGHERLHVLTHPEWWVPMGLSPRARVERCAVGRARANMREYDRLLGQHSRRNVDE